MDTKAQFTCKVRHPDGSDTVLCCPSVVKLDHAVIRGRRQMGVLLDVELTVLKDGWMAKSRAGTEIKATRRGALRDKTLFVL